METSDHLLTNKELRRGFFGLYFGRMAMSVANGLIGIFLPIFLYNLLDGNVSLIMLYYGLTGLAYVFLVAFGAQFLNKFGFRRSLVLGSFLAAVVNAAYFFVTKENAFLLLSCSLVALVLFRMFFWIPFHVDFAIFTNKGKKGGQVGLMLGTMTLVGIAGPMIAGYIIQNWSMQVLFFIGVLVYILSMIPFKMVPRTNERFSWTYKKVWQELFAKKNRGIVWASVAVGAEDIIGFTIWPIFIFVLLKGNYFQVGALESFIVGITVLLQLMFGRYLDRIEKKHRTLRMSSVLYAFGWIIKIFVATAAQVFVVGLYHRITKVLTDTSYDAIFYETAADQGHYVDEYTVLSEMAINIGRVVGTGAVAILLVFLSLKWTFIVGAAASLVFITLSATHQMNEKRA
ncbi:MAG: MFS transporter [Candidatus Paceibacterota bacterium]|jgi:YQGE family putative transporter